MHSLMGGLVPSCVPVRYAYTVHVFKLGDECSQSFCSAESRESSMVPKRIHTYIPPYMCTFVHSCAHLCPGQCPGREASRERTTQGVPGNARCSGSPSSGDCPWRRVFSGVLSAEIRSAIDLRRHLVRETEACSLRTEPSRARASEDSTTPFLPPTSPRNCVVCYIVIH